ncbi:toprim domain-containing protein [Reyranella sp.]|uniref:DUF7146 domain-containing protein n=1 Tax=Reyranella sp. TaxID=1929291 RepID=UPI003784C0E8
MTAATIARTLGGRKSGNGFLLKCIAHDDSSPSLSIADGDDGRLLVRCHAGCDALDILAGFRRRGLLDDDHQHDHHRDRPAPHARPATPTASADKIADILRLAGSLSGTLGERYLRTRGCAMPTSNAVRYLAPSAKHLWPTIVSIVSDFVTGETISLHFTMLNADGADKAPLDQPRRLLAGHRKAGGVIRLVDDADVTAHLGIGEGIETCLAITAALGAQAPWLPVWSAIDAGNLAGLPVLPGIERLTIFADTDRTGTGQKAAQTLAARWHAARREVFIAQPPAPPGGKRDWNG